MDNILFSVIARKQATGDEMAERGVDPTLIDRIYEAAIIGSGFPAVLQEIADRIGAAGALVMTRSPEAALQLVSPKIERVVQDFVAEGWPIRLAHTAKLFEEQHPGFRSETDYYSADELARLPVHAEFLDPRGFICGAATVIQGAGDRVIHLSIEGFRSCAAAEKAISMLDRLRPDLARALSLAELRRQRSQDVVDSLQLVGVAAAIVRRDGRMRSANNLFTGRLANDAMSTATELRFRDRFVQMEFRETLAKHALHRSAVQSVPIRAGADRIAHVLHLLPITGRAAEMCDADGILLLLVDPANQMVPGADLLRLLFDLTPSEARVARELSLGRTLAQAAVRFGVTEATARVHLRAIFAKTGVTRQADLILLLTGVAAPI